MTTEAVPDDTPDPADLPAHMTATRPAGVYRRLPLRQDLVAATWPAYPLTPDEVAEATRLGLYLVAGDYVRCPVFNALTRQDIADELAGGTSC